MNIKILTSTILLLFISCFGFSKMNANATSNSCFNFVFIPSDYNGQTISCHDAQDGTLTVNAFSGAAPYTFLWENGATGFQRNNLGTGTYSVTVTDNNGCSLNSSIDLVAPSANFHPKHWHLKCHPP